MSDGTGHGGVMRGDVQKEIIIGYEHPYNVEFKVTDYLGAEVVNSRNDGDTYDYTFSRKNAEKDIIAMAERKGANFVRVVKEEERIDTDPNLRFLTIEADFYKTRKIRWYEKVFGL